MATNTQGTEATQDHRAPGRSLKRNSGSSFGSRHYGGNGRFYGGSRRYYGGGGRYYGGGGRYYGGGGRFYGAGNLVETVLLALYALGSDGPGGANPIMLSRAIASLRLIGLDGEARALAIEAAIAAGV